MLVDNQQVFQHVCISHADNLVGICPRLYRRSRHYESRRCRPLFADSIKQSCGVDKSRVKTLSPLPLKGGGPIRERKSPFKGSPMLITLEYVSDLEGLFLGSFSENYYLCAQYEERKDTGSG